MSVTKKRKGFANFLTEKRKNPSGPKPFGQKSQEAPDPFGKRRKQKLDDLISERQKTRDQLDAELAKPKPKLKANVSRRGVYKGEPPVTLQKFAAYRRSTPTLEQSHYKRYLDARDSTEARRLADALADGLARPVSLVRA